MKRLLLIVSLSVTCIACTNDEQKDNPVSPSNYAAADTASRGDTASYERMPQPTNDSTRK